MTKSEAEKWGTAVEGATGGDDVSQKVCGTAGSNTNNCGQNTGTNGKLSTAFTEDTTTLLSAADTTINTAGMAIPV
ncbi:hypothetical protein [Anaplasma ovis]|nr:hypothetical protein [Anaplasma ovis]